MYKKNRKYTEFNDSRIQRSWLVKSIFILFRTPGKLHLSLFVDKMGYTFITKKKYKCNHYKRINWESMGSTKHFGYPIMDAPY